MQAIVYQLKSGLATEERMAESPGFAGPGPEDVFITSPLTGGRSVLRTSPTVKRTRDWVVGQFAETAAEAALILRHLRRDLSRALSKQLQTVPLPVIICKRGLSRPEP
jgi:hypothetical protein